MFITLAKIYRVNGVTFEWHEYLGPIILNRHTEEERPYRNVSGRNWRAIHKFTNMTREKRELFRIY
jgi:hypothetical protein